MGDAVVVQEDGKVRVRGIDAPAGTAPRQLDGDNWQIAWHGRDGRLPAMRCDRLLWLDPQTGETQHTCTLPINDGEAQSFYFNPDASNAHSAFAGHAGPAQLKTTRPVERWGHAGHAGRADAAHRDRREGHRLHP